MPAQPVLVYEKETGTATYMHSVDAREAVQLGDYTYAAPSQEPSSEARAAARSKFQAGMAVAHPELQSEEERQRLRDEANERAELTAMIPEGAQVVVMAPSASERSQRQATRPSSTRASTPPPGQSTPATPPPAEASARRPRE